MEFILNILIKYYSQIIFLFIGLLGQKMFNFLKKYFIKKKVEEAYKYLEWAYKPEVLHPKDKGNPHHIQTKAKNLSNSLINPLKRLNFKTPRQCSEKKESLKDWYEFLEDVRINLS